MKKRILFILPGFTFGGTVFSTLNMISLLPKNQYEIYLLAMTHQGPVKELYNSITVLPENLIISSLMGRIDREHSLGRKMKFFFIKVLRRICRGIGVNLEDRLFKRIASKLQKKYKFDIVCSCQEGSSTYFAHAFEDAKKIAWFRSEYGFYLEILTPAEFKYEKQMYCDFDNIVCVSKTTCHDFIAHIPKVEHKTLGIHNIQNTRNILSKGGEIIDDTRFDTSKFTIVSVGRFAPQKRFSTIPQIANRIKSLGCDFKWYIIGDGNVDNEQRQTIENIKKYGLEENVILLGSKLNPYPYIKAANVLVNTSYYEACPRVVIESKILKTPVVCADFSSASEFVHDSFDGYVQPLNKLSTIIHRMIVDENTYAMIHKNCQNFEMNNEFILEQLQTVLQTDRKCK